MLPRDTGNLQDNAFQLHHTAKWQWTITVELETAPYFIFVNETPPFPRSVKEVKNKQVWQRVVAFVTQEFERGVADIQRQINTRTR